MEDLNAKLKKLLSEADDCELIGKLACDPKKRELFRRLATDLKAMARDIEAVIARGEVAAKRGGLLPGSPTRSEEPRPPLDARQVSQR